MQEEEARGSDNLKYKCRCSFLEIYNEQVADLLEPSSSNLQVNFALTFIPVLWPMMLFFSFFSFSIFYRLDLCNETCVALPILQWSIHKSQHTLEPPKSYLPWFGNGNRKCMFVKSLTEYIGSPPILFTIEWSS